MTGFTATPRICRRGTMASGPEVGHSCREAAPHVGSCLTTARSSCCGATASSGLPPAPAPARARRAARSSP